jgi:hypothetical protein
VLPLLLPPSLLLPPPELLPPLLLPPPELLAPLLLPPPPQYDAHVLVMQVTMSLKAADADDESDEVHPRLQEVDDVGQLATHEKASRQVESAVHALHAESHCDVRQPWHVGSLLNTGTMHDAAPSSADPPSAGFRSLIPSMDAQALVQRINAAPAVSTASSPLRGLPLVAI